MSAPYISKYIGGTIQHLPFDQRYRSQYYKEATFEQLITGINYVNGGRLHGRVELQTSTGPTTDQQFELIKLIQWQTKKGLEANFTNVNNYLL